MGGMPYRDQPGRPAPHRGRDGKAYRALCTRLREQVARGRVCWFYGRPGHDQCPRTIDLGLPSQHRYAFTAHHLQRLMDGGPAVPRLADMAPAHRACNARDGLHAQNARRRTAVSFLGGQPLAGRRPDLPQDATSQEW